MVLIKKESVDTYITKVSNFKLFIQIISTGQYWYSFYDQKPESVCEVHFMYILVYGKAKAA